MTTAILIILAAYAPFLLVVICAVIVGARADDPLPNHKARSRKRNSEGGDLVSHRSAIK